MTSFRGQASCAKNDVMQGEAKNTDIPHNPQVNTAE